MGSRLENPINDRTTDCTCKRVDGPTSYDDSIKQILAKIPYTDLVVTLLSQQIELLLSDKASRTWTKAIIPNGSQQDSADQG